MEEFLEAVRPLTHTKIFVTIVVFIGVFLIQYFLNKILIRNSKTGKEKYYWRKISTGLTGIVLVLLLGKIWMRDTHELATYFGLLSAGVAIALKDPITNMVGALFIVWRKPFSLGDRIEIGTTKGDVVDIRLFQFSIVEIGGWLESDSSTGRIIHIPNSKVFSDSQINYNQGTGKVWNEVGVLITFESDWKKAKYFLTQIVTSIDLKNISGIDGQGSSDLILSMLWEEELQQPQVITNVKDSGVLLTLRYPCSPKHKRISTEWIWEKILDEFEKDASLELAYPTQRIFRLPAEHLGVGNVKKGYE